MPQPLRIRQAAPPPASRRPRTSRRRRRPPRRPCTGRPAPSPRCRLNSTNTVGVALTVAPPASARSHSPERSDCTAMCSATSDDEHAVSTDTAGPSSPSTYDTRPGRHAGRHAGQPVALDLLGQHAVALDDESGEHAGGAAAQAGWDRSRPAPTPPTTAPAASGAAGPSPAPRSARCRRTPRRSPRHRPRSRRCARTYLCARVGVGVEQPGQVPAAVGRETPTSRRGRRPPSATGPPGNRPHPGSGRTSRRSRSARSTAPAAHGWCASGAPPGPALCAALRSHAGVDQPSLTSPNPRLTLAVCSTAGCGSRRVTEVAARSDAARFFRPGERRAALRPKNVAGEYGQLRRDFKTSDTPGF